MCASFFNPSEYVSHSCVSHVHDYPDGFHVTRNTTIRGFGSSFSHHSCLQSFPVPPLDLSVTAQRSLFGEHSCACLQCLWFLNFVNCVRSLNFSSQRFAVNLDKLFTSVCQSVNNYEVNDPDCYV